MVVVRDAANGAGRYEAINACIRFLPTLHGKELLTIESLSNGKDDLHPAQRAIVEQHGSQCGFCTPGFVMSLFALYHSDMAPGRTAIDDALAGNLCRCTGYRPIVAAAQAMYDYPRPATDQQPAPIGDHDTDVATNRGDRRYFAPATLDELLRLRADMPSATLLAGGTDIGLWVTKQHRQLDDVIHTGRVPELLAVDVGSKHIEIGAAVTLADAMLAIVPHYPQVEALFRRFGSPPIRNAGTLGGNVANGSPIGDSMPFLIAADATLVLRSQGDVREIALEDFYTDYMQNELRNDEIVERIRIPLPGDGVVVHSHKLSKRFDQDISAVCTAYRLELDGERVTDFRMACGGMAATVRRAAQTEAAVIGQPWNEATIAQARDALAADFTPISDMRASAGYRLRATRNLLTRFFLETTGSLADEVYGHGRG